jgi:hypothetical protein
VIAGAGSAGTAGPARAFQTDFPPPVVAAFHQTLAGSQRKDCQGQVHRPLAPPLPSPQSPRGPPYPHGTGSRRALA